MTQAVTVIPGRLIIYLRSVLLVLQSAQLGLAMQVLIGLLQTLGILCQMPQLILETTVEQRVIQP